MIEGNIINLADLNDLFPKIEIYNYPKIEKLFHFFYILNKYKPNSQYLFYFSKCLYFLQIIKHTFLGTPEIYQNIDTFLRFINYFQYILFPHEYINSKKYFIIFILISYIFIFIIIIFMIYLFFKMNNPNKFIIRIFSFLSFIIINYLFCPLLNILCLSFVSKNGKHIFTNEKINSSKFFIFTILSSLFILFITIYMILLSFFFNEIGNLTKKRIYCRIDTNFEIYTIFHSIIIYISGFIQYHYYNFDSFYRDINRVFILLSSLGFYIYYFFYVYYYNYYVNLFFLCSYSYLCWISFSLLIASSFTINDLILFIFIGCFILTFLSIIIENYRIEYYLFNVNVYKASSIKELEIFISGIEKLSQLSKKKDKIAVTGIINSFEDYFNSNLDNKDNYYSLLENQHMQNKFGKNGMLLKIYAIIYSIYYTFTEKSNMKEEVLIRFGYFLMNKLKNFGYCSYLCIKMKFVHYKQMYLKYNLMEEIKEYLLEGLYNNIVKKDTYYHVEVTRVILYYKYIEDLKLKIFDAASNQVEYFDILRTNNDININSSDKLLKIGNSLLILRNEIISLWEKIININPFCYEAEKDYIMYIENIIQDDELYKEENKKFNFIKNKEEKKKNSKYYSLFSKDNTIILVDGFNSKGKILYFTPNFPEIFNLSPKECYSLYIYDLMPKYISEFHDHLVKYVLKYTNLKTLYKKERNISIKINDNLYDVNLFIKILPNLSNGLIYLISIRNLQLQYLNIVTDNLFRINGISDNLDILKQNENEIILNQSPILLNKLMIGKNISLLIPDILKYVEYDEQKYIIDNDDNDFIGTFFLNTTYLNETIVNDILDKIKDHGKLLFMYEENNSKSKHSTSLLGKRKTDINIDYSLFSELYSLCKNSSIKSYSINFKVITKSYFNDKYIFFKFFIQKDKNVQDIIQSMINKESTPNLLFFKKEKCIKIKVKDIISTSMKKSRDENEKLMNLPNNIKKTYYQKNFKYKKTSSKRLEKIQNESIYSELRKKIINKKNPYFFSNLSLMIIIFSIATFLLITINNLSIDKKFNYIKDYLNDNYYLNNSKIQTSMIYIISSQFILIRLGFGIKDHSKCSGNCIESYKNILLDVLLDLKNGLTKSLYFDEDFKHNILSLQKMLVYVNNEIPPQEDIADVYSILYFIIADNLKIINNINDYVNGNDTILIQIHNTFLNSYFYCFNENIGYGYYGKEKINKLNESKFCMSYVYLLINLLFFVISFIYVIFVIYKKYRYEIYYLEKIINFQNEDFDAYLKYLQDLKKKLKNESTEHDEEKDDENYKSSHKDSERTKKNKFDKDKKRESIQEKPDNMKYKSKKNKRIKILKLYQKKAEKKNIMSKYFLRKNLISGYKIGSICIFAMLYYLIIYFLYNSQKTKYINIDNIEGEIISSALNTFLDYIQIKHEIYEYSTYYIQLKECLNIFNDNNESSCIIDYKEYTIENISNIHFKFELNNLNIYNIKEKGNLMINLINDDNMNINTIKGKLAQIHIGDMCKSLHDYNNINYTECSLYWDSIISQGLKQSIIYAESVLKRIVTIFEEYNDNNDENKLTDTINEFYSVEIYIMKYYFPAVRYEIWLFNLFKNDKINFMLAIFNFIVYLSIVEIITLYVILMISLFQMKATNSLMNFVVIFPLRYVHENNDFYNDIINLNNNFY